MRLIEICGIYTIHNKITNKYYIGYSYYIQGRFDTHKYQLRANIHGNIYLQNAWNKYGEDSFEFELLEEYPEELLPAMEHYWATLLNSHDRKYGYNIGITDPNGINKKSEETIKRISVAKKGKPSPRKGKKMSEEFKRNVSIRMKGKTYKKGKKATQQTRNNISLAKKGIPLTAKRIKNILKLDLNDNILCVYKDMYECAEKENIKLTTIYNQLIGVNKKLRNKNFKLKLESNVDKSSCN